MKTTVKNTSKKDMEFTIIPALLPYVNIPQMVAWDLPEWYLASTPRLNGKVFCIRGQMNDPGMVKENYRSVTFNMDYEEDAEFELDMSKFARSGSFFAPDAVINGLSLTNKMSSAEKINTYSGSQAVWTFKYKVNLAPNQSKIYTQVLTVQEAYTYSEEENVYEQSYFNADEYLSRLQSAKDFYEDMFTKRTVTTSNELYNNFINNFTPLQMFWVCSLDRGWPSSMRGVRDASQDFMGMLELNPTWTRELIISLFRHQRTDGWMPRQISTISRSAPHDMRYFSDGGAFLLELIHLYLTFTRDYTLLYEKAYWLDSDNQDTILDHIVKTMDYYLAPNNIGEHGLCKVWYGDWWDVMDKIGMDGRGETVTVTMQNVLNLRYLIDMLNWLDKISQIDKKYLSLIDVCKKARESFSSAINKHAYNGLGFYNGYFNDKGEWLLSDNDPDGEERLYLVSNSWSIISGVADQEKANSVIDNIENRNFGIIGYNTGSKNYTKPIEKAGRVGIGAEIDHPYNHAQSFFVRACCLLGDAERAYKATRYILPIEEEYAPVEMTFSPPYAIANGYSGNPDTLHRVQFQFLSGTVSYTLRIVYNYFFGITYSYDGLILKPCIPAEFGNCSVNFTYLGKKFTINFTKTDSKYKTVKFNGEEYDKKTFVEEQRKEFTFIPDEFMRDQNVIDMEY